MQKFLKVLLILLFISGFSSCQEKKLPLPSVESGLRGELGIDANINESTIDLYLGRKDSVYRDMRMLKDEANYEAIGGDSYLSGIVSGFEVVPYPYLCNVEGLPEAVGNTYTGVTLFSYVDGEYLPNYTESMSILETLFPKDKYIFLMCGGGGYAGMTKNMLVALGWDETKIYNTGGYWYYEGNNKIETKYETNGETHYDFSKIIYHDIDFNTLDKIRESGTAKTDDTAVTDENTFIPITSNEELNKVISENEQVLIHVYLPGCSSCAKFLPIVQEFQKLNGCDIYSVSLRDIWYEDNPIKDKVQYTPSLFCFKNGEVIAYLDPTSDADLDYYKSVVKLSEWASAFMEVKAVTDDVTTDIENCETGCSIDS
ncbi:MAG: thioredoxin family protein [Erysipelotrichaceae bacterium]|nr:thioredoxin family protein [Erysipelotrichaceae bacterium]